MPFEESPGAVMMPLEYKICFYDRQKMYHCIKLNQFRFCYSTAGIKSDLIVRNNWIITPIINQ